MSDPTSLIQAGIALSNVCYNLSQQGMQVLQPRHAESMRQAHVEWDRALTEYRAAVKPKQPEVLTMTLSVDTGLYQQLLTEYRALSGIATRLAEAVDQHIKRGPACYGMQVLAEFELGDWKMADIDTEAEHHKAQAAARERGMAFLIDGVHVPAERVEIVSPPEGVGPIADMRAVVAEAKAALKELRDAQSKQVVSVKLDTTEVQAAIDEGLEQIKIVKHDNEALRDTLKHLQAKHAHLLHIEHALSDSYVRIREIVGAMSPPSTDPVALYPYVEAMVKERCSEPFLKRHDKIRGRQFTGIIFDEHQGGKWQELPPVTAGFSLEAMVEHIIPSRYNGGGKGGRLTLYSRLQDMRDDANRYQNLTENKRVPWGQFLDDKSCRENGIDATIDADIAKGAKS